MKKVFVNVGLCLFSSLLALMAVEVYLRAVDWKPSFKLGEPSDLIGAEILLDDKLGFRFKPHTRDDINNYGFRDDDFSIEKSSKKRILFLGDSFIMAVNVNLNLTAPKILDMKLGEDYEVYNMGVQGYGPDQSLIILNDLALNFKPDMVVLGIFPPNDFNDITKNRLYVQGPSGGIAFNRDNPVANSLPFLRTEYMISHVILKNYPASENFIVEHYRQKYHKLFPLLLEDLYDYDLERNPSSKVSQEKVAVFKEVLKQIAEVCRDNGIPFFAVIIPYDKKMRELSALDESYLSMWNDEKIFFLEDTAEDICKELSVDCIPLHKVFRERVPREQLGTLYDASDPHLSEYGTAVLAEIVREHIMEECDLKERP